MAGMTCPENSNHHKNNNLDMIRKPLVMLVLLCTTVFVLAQDKDFGIWYTIEAQKEIVKDLDLDVDINLRTYHDAGEVEEGFIDVGLG